MKAHPVNITCQYRLTLEPTGTHAEAVGPLDAGTITLQVPITLGPPTGPCTLSFGTEQDQIRLALADGLADVVQALRTLPDTAERGPA